MSETADQLDANADLAAQVDADAERDDRTQLTAGDVANAKRDTPGDAAETFHRSTLRQDLVCVAAISGSSLAVLIGAQREERERARMTERQSSPT